MMHAPPSTCTPFHLLNNSGQHLVNAIHLLKCLTLPCDDVAQRRRICETSVRGASRTAGVPNASTKAKRQATSRQLQDGGPSRELESRDARETWRIANDGMTPAS
mmetsp:Transcript_14089/g.42992  ORF Transcript_14089/g.42992 Transcript_14089/m.42992 type:complete len:105 (+) Transcript_14089:337-651(+)